MTQPAIEVADIVRAKGGQYLEHYQSSVNYQELKAYRAAECCRIAALGGHKDKCVKCQYEAPHSYNSCRSRCCPQCQAQERRRWLQAQRDLLNTNYFHVVFTASHELNPLALTSPSPLLDLHSTPVPRPCSKSLPIQSGPAQRLDSSPSCILGVRLCWAITTSIASSPAVDCRQITGDRVRITVKLVRTGPERLIWADAYEGDIQDVLIAARCCPGYRSQYPNEPCRATGAPRGSLQTC